MRYAIVRDGIVENVHELEEGSTWQPPEGCQNIACPDGVATGWTHDGETFSPPAPAPVTPEQVDAERDRRTDAGIVFDGAPFQSRPQDRENVQGAFSLASMAIVGGAEPGDLYWHGGAQPFVWIAADNGLVQMDAFTVINFGRAMAAHKSAMIFAARALKDADPIPADFADDGYWT